MKRLHRILWGGLLAALMLAPAAAVAAQELSANEIVKKAKHMAYYQGKDGNARVKMTITDAQGRTVSFENTVICMTSNAGSTDRVANVGFDKTVQEMSQEKSMKALRDFLRPEFLSRVDEIIAFKPLQPQDLNAIAALMLGEYREPLATKGIEIHWDEAALDLLRDKAKGGKFGARDLRRVIRKEVEDRIAEGVVSDSRLEKVHVGAKDDEVVVTLS